MSIREQLLVVVLLYSQLRWLIVQLLTVTVGVVILMSASVFLYGSFYYWYMPSVLHDRPVHFTFRTNCIAHEMSCGFPTANLSLVSNNRELLMYGQPYIVKLQLEMPESSVNQRLGMFMVELQFYTRHAETVFTAARSAMISYKSWLYRTLETLVFFVPSLIFSLPVQKQLISVELSEGYYSDPYQPTFGALLQVQAQQIEIYKASLKIFAKFSGLRYFMFHWPMLSTVFGVAVNFFFFSVIAIFSWFAYVFRSNDESVSWSQKSRLRGNVSVDSVGKATQKLDRSSHSDTSAVITECVTKQPDSSDEIVTSGIKHRTVSKN